jgi:hypothetical protein
MFGELIFTSFIEIEGRIVNHYSLIKSFNGWLIKQNYLHVGETVFRAAIPEKVPEWIATWILDEYVDIYAILQTQCWQM